jgi:hypothetical protein
VIIAFLYLGYGLATAGPVVAVAALSSHSSWEFGRAFASFSFLFVGVSIIQACISEAKATREGEGPSSGAATA